MTPQQRWLATLELWRTYLIVGGSLDPEPDTQSPFFDANEPGSILTDGGQACVSYGAAEFSRDIDLVVMVDEENNRRLTEALSDLWAEVIAVPDFSETLLARGHAVHFRSQHPEAKGLRIDPMATELPLDPG